MSVNIYDIFMLPLELALLRQVRRRLMPQAAGDVLEVGTGTGANFPYYNYSQIKQFVSIDVEPAPDGKLPKLPVPAAIFVEGSVESLPFPDASFDTVVVSLVLCTADIEKSLAEVWRVLRPKGMLISIEHVKPTGTLAGKIVEHVNPLWRRIANGCNINRHTDTLLRQSRFVDVNMQQAGVFRYGTARKEG
jgi:ubiquinone/menaquinone biosynthesis C-methylase UbiE